MHLRSRCSLVADGEGFAGRKHEGGEDDKTRVVVLGAGFGGLELTTVLSDALGDALDITLIDKCDAFVFGFSKLDVMFGRRVPAESDIPTATS